MLINRIQSYNYTPQFQGTIRLQNLKKEGEFTKINTTLELDRGLAQLALRNFFKGRWENEGNKCIPCENLMQYTETLWQTLGIKIPSLHKKSEQIVLKHFKNGYSIKSDGNYKITHIREDQIVWD